MNDLLCSPLQCQRSKHRVKKGDKIFLYNYTIVYNLMVGVDIYY